MNENQATIQSYRNNADEYIKSRNYKEQKVYSAWIVEALQEFKKPIDIFEIGSGPGYLADFLESLGYPVNRSDIVDEFIDFNKSRGKSTLKHDIKSDKFAKSYDAMIAVNVMQHLSHEDFDKSLGLIHDGLRPGGEFIFTIVLGEPSQWRSDKGGDRFFAGWEHQDLVQALASRGFEVIYSQDIGYKNWANIVAKKTLNK